MSKFSEFNKCPHCSFSPESDNDYCEQHKPKYSPAAPVKESRRSDQVAI